jgi:two-component system response regulator PilR (NtrC family)
MMSPICWSSWSHPGPHAGGNPERARHRNRTRLLQTESFDLCLTDMRLPDGNGLDLVAWIQENHTAVPVAVISAHGNIESAVRALKLGAFDFVSKPLDLGVLRKLVGSASNCGRAPTAQRRSPCRGRASSAARLPCSSCAR